MLTPAGVWRRRSIESTSATPSATRSDGRSGPAIVLPIAATVGFAVGGGSQTPMFAIFGSVALLIIVDFPGNRPARALAYCGLGFNGAVLITLGSLVAPIPWLAVTTMFVLGVAVTFSGVLSEIVAAGQRSTLLTFVLPACTPVGPIPDRLLGWAIALAPGRARGDVPASAATPRRTAQARRAGVPDPGRPARRQRVRRRRLDRDGRAARQLPRRRLPAGRADRGQPRAGACRRRPAVAVGSHRRRHRGPALRDTRPDRAGAARERGRAARTEGCRPGLPPDALASALDEQRTLAQSRYRDDIVEILGEPSDAAAIDSGRRLLSLRTISACVGATGRVIRLAAAADARPVWARVLGRRLPVSGASDRVLSESEAIASLTTGFVATRAVVVRNSLRTGLGLAAAVAITHVFPVQHGFWVVLGAMSVLRSSALTTGTRVVRAVGGTAIGFVLGAVFIELMGVDSPGHVGDAADRRVRLRLRARGGVVRGRPGDVHDDGADHLQPDRADRVERRTDPHRGRDRRRVRRCGGVDAALAAGRHVAGGQDRRRGLRGGGAVPRGDGAACHPRRVRGVQRSGHRARPRRADGVENAR